MAANSNVETYVALQVEIDNWRWAGVPFYLRTGKYMSQRNTEIAIRFKQAPYAAFQDTPVDTLRPNWLVPHRAEQGNLPAVRSQALGASDGPRRGENGLSLR